MAKKTKEILNAKDVADYLNVHLFTVHKYAREGRIPAFKIGADWRFHRKSIEKWIKEKEQSNVETGNSAKQKKEAGLFKS
ncbi:MAG: helix-turn-helix domain-containing protein [Candidatus Omnitrophica bacterium]|nr:helix-turn-helix domain-containing protein [Candidatus Omnitrophota bacterium]MDD5352239.1 helix-turn-helix domain-containing protein [Candidatus Omnitrophota bacterium]MDD5549837.1 helix-turn-helix domain-containing protein [Candidatus Omnitrophota bacterium]